MSEFKEFDSVEFIEKFTFNFSRVSHSGTNVGVVLAGNNDSAETKIENVSVTVPVGARGAICDLTPGIYMIIELDVPINGEHLVDLGVEDAPTYIKRIDDAASRVDV